MTLQDLERIAFLLRNRIVQPDELAAPWEAAILNCLNDPAGRSLDYWLALPPRPSRTDYDFVQQRNGLYRQLAATIDGSTHIKSQIICDDLEIWRAGEAAAASFGAMFEKFLREYRELEPPHLKQTALRAVITPKSCH